MELVVLTLRMIVSVSILGLIFGFFSPLVLLGLLFPILYLIITKVF